MGKGEKEVDVVERDLSTHECRLSPSLPPFCLLGRPHASPYRVLALILLSAWCGAALGEWGEPGLENWKERKRSWFLGQLLGSPPWWRIRVTGTGTSGEEGSKN